MNDLGLTVPKLAKAAGVDETTIRALLGCQRWPRPDTRHRINRALGWPLGELGRRSTGPPDLSEYPTLVLLEEVCRRLEEAEHMPWRDTRQGNGNAG